MEIILKIYTGVSYKSYVTFYKQLHDTFLMMLLRKKRKKLNCYQEYLNYIYPFIKFLKKKTNSGI